MIIRVSEKNILFKIRKALLEIFDNHVLNEFVEKKNKVIPGGVLEKLPKRILGEISGRVLVGMSDNYLCLKAWRNFKKNILGRVARETAERTLVDFRIELLEQFLKKSMEQF